MGKQKSTYLQLITLAIAFIYLRSSYGKFSEGKFVGTLGLVLNKFTEHNPYPIVVAFLKNVAIPNSQLFGQLTMWGELFVGLSLLISALALFVAKAQQRLFFFILCLGLATAIILNSVFYLAAAWTSVSTESLNLLMLLSESVIFVFALNKFLKSVSR